MPQQQHRVIVALCCGVLSFLSFLQTCHGLTIKVHHAKPARRTIKTPVVLSSAFSFKSYSEYTRSGLSGTRTPAGRQSILQTTLQMTTDPSDPGDAAAAAASEDRGMKDVAPSSPLSIPGGNVNNNASSSSSTTTTGDVVKKEERTVQSKLLTVPLFLKFIAVLLIKFVTDVVVYPLLLFYRLARRTKRKVLRLLGGGDNGSSSNNNIKPNGSTWVWNRRRNEPKGDGMDGRERSMDSLASTSVFWSSWRCVQSTIRY